MSDHRDTEQPDADVARVEALLRELTAEDAQLDAPPPDVWDGIASEVGESERADNVVGLGSRRRLFSDSVLRVAAAGVVLIAGVTAFLVLRDTDSSSVVASAQLAYDPASFDVLGVDAEAAVSLVNDGDQFSIQVDSADLPTIGADSEDLELWLIEPDADGNPVALVSLGLIDPDDPGAFDVPANYDPDVYFVVDISVEPRDGDATHSGRSILRGALAEA